MADLVTLNINDAPRSFSESPPSSEERPSSAPGRMDNCGSQEERILDPEYDVRLDPSYPKFYNAYQGDERLPPPLQGSIMSELWDKNQKPNASAGENCSQPVINTAYGTQPETMEFQDDLNDILEPPSPDSTTSMSFSLAQRLAVSCLDSPHLSPMSGVVPQSPQIPGALQGTKQAVPSRQRGGISLGGIPNAETWMSGGWEPQPPQPPPLQQQQMQQQMQQQIFGQGMPSAPSVTQVNSMVAEPVVIGGMPYHVVPHQQWVQMMNGQQVMQAPRQDMRSPAIHNTGGRRGRGGQRKEQHGRGQRRGRGSRNGAAFNNSAHEVAQTLDMGVTVPYSDISEVVGKIYALSKDQLGCRFLQKCLDNGHEVADLIFNEIEPHFIELMTDPFGNYLCQKLMEVCQLSLRTKIVELLAPSLAEVCFDSHGTRAVQRLIAIVTENNSQEAEQEIIVAALKQHLISLVRNLNGNHVVQACLHHLSSDTNKFIFDSVTANCVHVATHRHGCCVMQRCIDYGNTAQREALISEIVGKALLLVQDPYGNYVIQYILEIKSDQILRDIFELLRGNFVKLSMGKFSSNVVEKCLTLLSTDCVASVLAELSQPEAIGMLLKDSYANYVIQKAILLEHSAVYNLVLSIKPHLKSLRDTAYGKKLTAKLQKKFGVMIEY